MSEKQDNLPEEPVLEQPAIGMVAVIADSANIDEKVAEPSIHVIPPPLDVAEEEPLNDEDEHPKHTHLGEKDD